MTSTDWVLLGAAGVALAVSQAKSPSETKRALKIGYRSFRGVLPFFAAVFGAIGLLEVVISPQLIRDFLGAQSRLFAPLVAALVGGIAAGPPAAAFPIGRYLLDQGASVAAVATLLVAWVAVGTATLPAEMAYMGKKFALTRWLLMLAFSVAVGLIMEWLL